MACFQLKLTTIHTYIEQLASPHKSERLLLVCVYRRSTSGRFLEAYDRALHSSPWSCSNTALIPSGPASATILALKSFLKYASAFVLVICSLRFSKLSPCSCPHKTVPPSQQASQRLCNLCKVRNKLRRVLHVQVVQNTSIWTHFAVV